MTEIANKKTGSKPVLDELDKAIISSSKRNAGKNIAIILAPLRSPECSDPSLRYRVNTLARDGFLKLEKTRTGRVLVFPIDQ